ncbi:TetR/AcrR family transcriptional regulator [Paenibacillus sacheonensis]|uniref:TetR family transcriptional regulator n=1 Tax=Paenibacillus sacheonensis TaxID=742054 RepID=A0A7X5BYC8_9BACL|nr:TetR/AcrR family transcriptional regulator [Paenibacillus sacheonensis]MBM7566811.1 AcrR family transcriptional regulator [Paenibacillus sacheonensis]NBC71433.1 TetR family transcriptional regulator [Paenibacillus sacheonensis]
MQRELKKEQTRTRIKEAAMSLFSEQGYEPTTVEAIAKLAGVAKGTFFNYFSSKDDLLCDLQGIFAISEAGKLKDTPGPLVPRLQLLVFELVKRFEMNKPLTRALFQAMLSRDSALNTHNKLLNALSEALLPLILQAQENGEIRKDMPAEMLAQQAFQSYFGTLIIWAMEEGDEPLDTRMTMSFELFFKGIAPQ